MSNNSKKRSLQQSYVNVKKETDIQIVKKKKDNDNNVIITKVTSQIQPKQEENNS